jgi:hypothetical protein
MQRLLSLMIVLAHLGVASIPCVETDTTTASMTATATAQRATNGGRAGHSLPASTVEEHAGGHEMAEHPTEHASKHATKHVTKHANGHAHGEDAHAEHGGTSSHAKAAEPNHAHAKPQARHVQLGVRAPCLCGCNKTSNSPGTTTPQPPSFAPFEPESSLFVVAIPPIGESAPGPWPEAPPDVLDPIPILS